MSSIEKKPYLKVLRESALSIPFLFLFCIFVISMTSDVWMLWDGAQFHFENFFNGNLNNFWDYTRIASILISEFWDLAYTRIGGTSFIVSRYLFVFGHCYHIFFPFFLLVYLKFKEPELEEWMTISFRYYLLSLLSLTGFSFMFYVSEVKIAHTLSWLVLLSFRSRSEANGNVDFKDSFLWTISILALFTYPIVLVTFVLAFVSQMLPLKDGVTKNRGDWRIFFFIMAALTIYLLYLYFQIWTHTIPLSQMLNGFSHNQTSKILLLFIFFTYVLRPFFGGYFFIVCPAFVLVYIYGGLFRPGDSFQGRLCGVVLVALIQIMYVFIEPYISSDKWREGFMKRLYAVGFVVIGIISYQSYRIREFNNELLAIMDRNPRVLRYDEVKPMLHHSKTTYIDDAHIRQYSISLLLSRSEKNIDRYIDKRIDSHGDIIDNWTPETRERRTGIRNIKFSAPVIRNKP